MIREVAFVNCVTFPRKEQVTDIRARKPKVYAVVARSTPLSSDV
jgi:hypothetical protein